MTTRDEIQRLAANYRRRLQTNPMSINNRVSAYKKQKPESVNSWVRRATVEKIIHRLLYNHSLNPEERQQLQNYLHRRRWGI